MQKFVFLATFFLLEKKGPRKRERREKTKNAKYYGHYVALAHALRSDQFFLLKPNFVDTHKVRTKGA